MIVLGITQKPPDACVVLLSGTQSDPEEITIDKKTKKQKIAVDGKEEAKHLFDTLHAFCVLLRERKVEKVIILKAGNSPHGGPSAGRIKMEAVIQIASQSQSISVELISPQTLRAFEKKIETITGASPADVFNGGTPFSPQHFKDTYLTAWYGLN